MIVQYSIIVHNNAISQLQQPDVLINVWRLLEEISRIACYIFGWSQKIYYFLGPNEYYWRVFAGKVCYYFETVLILDNLLLFETTQLRDPYNDWFYVLVTPTFLSLTVGVWTRDDRCFELLRLLLQPPNKAQINILSIITKIVIDSSVRQSLVVFLWIGSPS